MGSQSLYAFSLNTISSTVEFVNYRSVIFHDLVKRSYRGCSTGLGFRFQSLGFRFLVFVSGVVPCLDLSRVWICPVSGFVTCLELFRAFGFRFLRVRL